MLKEADFILCKIIYGLAIGSRASDNKKVNIRLAKHTELNEFNLKPISLKVRGRNSWYFVVVSPCVSFFQHNCIACRLNETFFRSRRSKKPIQDHITKTKTCRNHEITSSQEFRQEYISPPVLFHLVKVTTLWHKPIVPSSVLPLPRYS